MDREKKQAEAKARLKAWRESLPKEVYWAANDPDPLIQLAVRLGCTTALPTTLDTETPKTTDGSDSAFT